MRIALLTLLVAAVGCKSSDTMQQNNEKAPASVPGRAPGPHALVYKTKGDYQNLVPVLLSDDKTEIVSYPHPKDLVAGGNLLLPTALNGGYMLDNRGIGKNVAFLRLTYPEYAALPSVPTLKELYGYILDKDPLEELCDCGNKSAFADIRKQLNELINKGTMRSTCTTIK